ncbi:MAG: ABC transporter ATP-binding protein, partial [Bacillota bacterium]|nr:ABC transporter ATP-binding protein [Bacillota bacterium]
IVNDVINYIKEINQAGITVLMVEQNARKALSIAHRACVLELGRVTLSGDAGEIAQNSAIIKSYLGGVKQK